MALGDYTKTVFINGTSISVPATPGDPAINGTNLNNAEDKIDELDTWAATADTDINTAQADILTNAGNIDTLELLAKACIDGLDVTTGTDADHDVNVTAGYCMDSTGVYKFSGGAMTKQIDASWAAGTNAGGFFPGGSVGASTVYYFFAIRKDSDESIDYGWDTSATAANKPAGYTYYRKLRTMLTDASSNLFKLTLKIDDEMYLRNKFSPMEAYTPTFTGFGSPTSVTFHWCRIGNMIKIFGKFTVGTPTATEARISLPNNYISDTAIIPSIMQCGIYCINAAGSFAIYTLIESGVSYMTIGEQYVSRAALTKQNGDVISGTGQIVTINCDIPIQGFNS